MATVSQAYTEGAVCRRLPRTTGSMRFLLLLALLASSSCSRPATAPATASPRLGLVGVLYGMYMAANDGEMPPGEAEFIEFIDASKQSDLKRYGFNTATEVFTNEADRPQLIVLYRDQREPLETEFVAIEEQKVVDQSGQQPKVRTKWFATDTLGVSKEIDEKEAARLQTKADATSESAGNPEPAESAEPAGAPTDGAAENEK